MRSISLVVPTLNEEQNILRTLECIFEYASNPRELELIVVDGGSTDSTVALLEQWQMNHPEQAITLLMGPAGRALQMNLGASHARADIVYFLHADTQPPKNYDKLIACNLDATQQAGCFRMAFDTNHWWLKLAAWGTRFNWRFCRGGDQSLFVQKDLFNQLGGYDQRHIICEDLNLIDRLYRATHFIVLPHQVISSARKYRTLGIWYLQWHFWVIQLNYRKGHTPEQLWAYYQRNIGTVGENQ